KEIAVKNFIRPLNFVVLSATLPEDAKRDQFPANDEERQLALDHQLLQKRIQAQKPTRFRVATKAKLPRSPSAEDRRVAIQALAATCVEEAKSLLNGERKRIGIMVNRVATAFAAYQELKKLISD